MIQRPASTRRTRDMSRGRPRRRSIPFVPSLLLTVSVALWTMAVVFMLASFFDDNVTAGSAGPDLARLFALSLFVSGFFGLLLSILLLRVRGDSKGLGVPVAAGVVAGGVESAFLLVPVRGPLVLSPAIILLLGIPPLSGVARGFLAGGRRG